MEFINSYSGAFYVVYVIIVYEKKKLEFISFLKLFDNLQFWSSLIKSLVLGKDSGNMITGKWPSGLMRCERSGMFLIQTPLDAWVGLGSHSVTKLPVTFRSNVTKRSN